MTTQETFDLWIDYKIAEASNKIAYYKYKDALLGCSRSEAIKQLESEIAVYKIIKGKDFDYLKIMRHTYMIQADEFFENQKIEDTNDMDEKVSIVQKAIREWIRIVKSRGAQK